MRIDHVHFYTKNARKVKDWFVRHLGFQEVGHSCDRHSYTEVVALNSACLVFSSPITSDSEINQYLQHHPSGVVDIAFRVQNLTAIMNHVETLGLKVLQFPQVKQLVSGQFRSAKIQGWNDLQHTLIEEVAGQLDYGLPDLTIKPPSSLHQGNSGFTQIDHIVLNVTAGKLQPAVELYQKLFGFKIQQSFKIKTAKSGLSSEALVDETGEVQFNINEPTSQNSQIQEFIDLNHGSGIQHLALRSPNLIADMQRMQPSQVDFLSVPASYYQNLNPDLELTPEEQKAIATHQILVDCDHHSLNFGQKSLLMQIFTRPIFEQPTFFLEFIERRGQARGFGQANFQALFEAVERELSH